MCRTENQKAMKCVPFAVNVKCSSSHAHFNHIAVVEFLNRHLSLIVTLQGVPCIAGLLYVYCVDEWPINCPCQS